LILLKFWAPVSVGVGIYFLALAVDTIWILERGGGPTTFTTIPWISMGVCGLIVGLLTKKDLFRNALVAGMLCAFCGGLMQYVLSCLGVRLDFPGLHGAALILAVVAAPAVLLVLIAGNAGFYVRRFVVAKLCCSRGSTLPERP
jgi:ABC-type Co2+ transport system permease subunit